MNDKTKAQYFPPMVLVEWGDKLIRRVGSRMMRELMVSGVPMPVMVEDAIKEIGPPPVSGVDVTKDTDKYKWLMGLINHARRFDPQAMSDHGLLTHYTSVMGEYLPDNSLEVGLRAILGLEVPDKDAVVALKFLIQDRKDEQERSKQFADEVRRLTKIILDYSNAKDALLRVVTHVPERV